jgi:hypothetical protein
VSTGGGLLLTAQVLSRYLAHRLGPWGSSGSSESSAFARLSALAGGCQTLLTLQHTHAAVVSWCKEIGRAAVGGWVWRTWQTAGALGLVPQGAHCPARQTQPVVPCW